MKRDQIVTQLFNSKAIICAVYLGLTKETKRNEAPKKNQSAETYLAKHSVLWGANTYELTQFRNSQAELDKDKELAPKYTPVAVEVDSIEMTKWGNRMKGKLHLIEA